jgi:hypothetical protein
VFIESQVVIGKLAFAPTHFLNQSLVFAFESDVGRVVLVDIFDLLLHLLNFVGDLDILCLECGGVVVAIIDLATATGCFHSHHATHTVVGDGAVHTVDLGVVADTGVVDLLLSRGETLGCGSLSPLGGGHSVRVSHTFKFKL